jgi:hypothetical protein
MCVWTGTSGKRLLHEDCVIVDMTNEGATTIESRQILFLVDMQQKCQIALHRSVVEV